MKYISLAGTGHARLISLIEKSKAVHRLWLKRHDKHLAEVTRKIAEFEAQPWYKRAFSLTRPDSTWIKYSISEEKRYLRELDRLFISVTRGMEMDIELSEDDTQMLLRTPPKDK